MYAFHEGKEFQFQDFQADERALVNAVRIMGPGPEDDATVLDVWDADSIAEFGAREKYIKVTDAAVGETSWLDIHQTAQNALTLGKERRLVARAALNIGELEKSQTALDFQPGDMIRLTSKRDSFNGQMLNMKMRVVSDTRGAAGDDLSAETVSIVVETAPETEEAY